MAWLTWSGLDADREERSAFRRAGITATDLLQLTVADVVGATDDLVTEGRAAELLRRATLLEIATPAKVANLERAGVRDRDDLAARDPDELLCAFHDTSPYTGPVTHDGLAALIHAARGGIGERSTPAWWLAQRQRSGFDPMRIAWRHRYGNGSEPWPTGRRLRIKSLRVNAPVAVAELDARRVPLPPFRHTDVTVALTTTKERGVTFVGHWMWAGRHGPFLHLEKLVPGSVVEVVDGRARDAYEITEVVRGIAPLDVAPPRDGILLLTPPHLRWLPWFKTWDLPAGTDPEQTWVQVAAIAEPVTT